MLGLDDHPAGTLPATGRIVKLSKNALLLPGELEAGRCQLDPRRSQLVDAAVLGDADNIGDAASLTPTEHLIPAKAAVAPEDDVNRWPGVPDALDQ